MKKGTSRLVKLFKRRGKLKRRRSAKLKLKPIKRTARQLLLKGSKGRVGPAEVKARDLPTLYKVLRENGSAPYADVPWSLPRPHYPGSNVWTAGMWHTTVGPLRLCSSGLHLSDAATIKDWAVNVVTYSRTDFRVFVAEVNGTATKHTGMTNKWLCRTARLTREVLRGSDEWKKLFKGTRWENGTRA